MRHRLSHTDHDIIDSSLHHDLDRQKQSSSAPNQRKRQRLHEQRDWIILLKFGIFLFLICIATFLAVQIKRHRVNVAHGMLRNGQGVDVANSSDENRAHEESLEQWHQNEQSHGIDRESIIDCPFYGCPITATEVSQLNNSNAANALSPNHIILTHKSNRKVPAPVNQDRAILISPFLPEEHIGNHPLQQVRSKDNFLMGIFDGHDNAGGDVAQFSMQQVPLRIAQKLKDAMAMHPPNENQITTNNTLLDSNIVKEAIVQSHEEVDLALPTEQSIMGGCTANVVLRLGSTLYMSNVGDSFSYLVTYTPPINGLHKATSTRGNENSDQQPSLQGSITIHHENTRHKPHLPEEQSRIKHLGGRIHIPQPPKSPMGSRVIVKSTFHKEDVGLAMSRSIGDFEWTKVGVIPTPDVNVIDLKDFFASRDVGKASELFVVVASDGLFDNRKKEFVTRQLARVLFELKDDAIVMDDRVDGQQRAMMLEGSKKLVAAVSPLKEEWYRDDISVIAKIIEL
jgi:serine/threonine protein phosphatase PrpC